VFSVVDSKTRFETTMEKIRAMHREEQERQSSAEQTALRSNDWIPSNMSQGGA
jgi:hypothetical protein